MIYAVRAITGCRIFSLAFAFAFILALFGQCPWVHIKMFMYILNAHSIVQLHTAKEKNWPQNKSGGAEKLDWNKIAWASVSVSDIECTNGFSSGMWCEQKTRKSFCTFTAALAVSLSGHVCVRVRVCMGQCELAWALVRICNTHLANTRRNNE